MYGKLSFLYRVSYSSGIVRGYSKKTALPTKLINQNRYFEIYLQNMNFVVSLQSK